MLLSDWADETNKQKKMPFRAMHDRAQGRTGLPWVMADKRLGQGSLKYWREANCLIKCDRISLEIFRKKKSACIREQPFDSNYWTFHLMRHLKRKENQAILIWEDSIRENSDPGLFSLERHMVIECLLLCEPISPLSHLISAIAEMPPLFCS